MDTNGDLPLDLKNPVRHWAVYVTLGGLMLAIGLEARRLYKGLDVLARTGTPA